MGALGQRRPLKLVFTYTFAERLGGSENILWTILGNIDRSRFEPVVIFFAEGPFEREVAGIGIRTRVVSLGRFRELRKGLLAVRAVRNILRDERPDLVINFILKAQLYGAPAAVLAGMRRRIVWWQHDMPGRQPLDRLATLLPARAIGTDSATSAEAQERYWPRRMSFPVLPGLRDPETVPEEEVAALRERLSIPGGRLVVGIVGRLQDWKGQHRLLEALATLRDAGHDDIHGLIVGGTQHGVEDDYERYVRQRTRELGLEGAVAFTGQVSGIGPYLQLMDVMVNASEPEPFGLVVLEAMAVGVPVVAVDAAGPHEILEGGQCGVLTPTGQPADLASGIERLLSDPDLRAEFSERGRLRFKDRFTVERMLHDFERRMEELV